MIQVIMGTDYFVGGLSHLSMDVAVDGDKLYIAAKDTNSNPQILKLNSNLTGNTTIEYDPQAGDCINVICGDITDQIWAAGNFGGAKVVRQSDFLGIYWSDVDQSTSWSGTAQPFMLGPEDDELALVINNYFLRETYFVGNDGPYWFTWTEDLPFTFNAFDRLSLDIDQIVFGNYFTDNPTAYFTPTMGLDFGDISKALLGLKQNVTSVIFGIKN